MELYNSTTVNDLPDTWTGIKRNMDVHIHQMKTLTFKFVDEFCDDENTYSMVTMNFKEEYYSHEKNSYYSVSYDIKDYVDAILYTGKDTPRCNPFYGITGEKLEFLMNGEPVLKNSFTEMMYKYLLMSDSELSKYTGRTTPQHYRKSLMLSIDNFWD